jgi:hypothetical protein
MLWKKYYLNGIDRTESVDMTFEQAVAELELLFEFDQSVARIEQMKMQNGTQSVSVKNRENKILIQYKTVID